MAKRVFLSVSLDESPEISALIGAWREGDQSALDRLTPLIYNELHRIARQCMRTQQTGQTLQTTALVHEAYLRLAHAGNSDWRDRAHFFAASAQIMRRILIDAARARGAQKRGAGIRQYGSTGDPLDSVPDPAYRRSAEFLALEDALARLASMDSLASKPLSCRRCLHRCQFCGGNPLPGLVHPSSVSSGQKRTDHVLIGPDIHMLITHHPLPLDFGDGTKSNIGFPIGLEHARGSGICRSGYLTPARRWSSPRLRREVRA